MKTINLVVVLLILLLSRAHSDEKKFERYKTSDGLPQNNVYAIVQDARGFMWFGTQEGLSRFDGYLIKTFQIDGSVGSLSSKTIYSLCTDKEGTLWVGTIDGLRRLKNTFAGFPFS